MYLVTASQMQSLDRRTIEEAQIPGLTLMERAGAGVVSVLERRFGPLAGKRIVIVCGKGNNGGDGFVVARRLHRKRARVTVLLLADPKTLSGDARTMYRRCVNLVGAARIRRQPTEETIRAMSTDADLLVDALLGTGLSSTVKDTYRIAIEAMNASPAPTIAVDVPSGINSDNGSVMGAAIEAEVTVTFGCPKVGLYLGEAINRTGAIELIDIGIPAPFVQELSPSVSLLTPQAISSLLPPRPTASHKGTYGHAGLIAGSQGKTGAAALAAMGALRVGAGLVTVATPETNHSTLEAKLLEAMTAPMPAPEKQSLGLAALDSLLEFARPRRALAIGPGIGLHAETGALLRALLPQLPVPCVLDADALNLLADHPEILTACAPLHILTPHPGEMARLIGHVSAQTVNQDRLGLAKRFSEAHRVVVVLKGARTIIAAPDGLAAICPTGNPGMATAGTGDVLTGMIVGLLVQGLSSWNAARAGVYLHGLAGDLAADARGQAGMIARDLLESIPYAIKQTQALS